VKSSQRIAAVLVYLIPVLGWLYVLLFMRRQPYVLFHACQAMALTLIAVLAPAAWAVAGWALAWIPFFGPITAAGSFALVIGAYVALVAAWIGGLSNALSDQAKAAPLYGGWGIRLYYRLSPQAR
jgi:uncharacterized membrane protein